MDLAIGHYVRFKVRAGGYIPTRSYQNFFVGETRAFLSVSYSYGPFALSGSGSNRGGDQGQSALVMPCNDLSTNLIAEAVLNSWLLEVNTVYIVADEGVNFAETSLLSREIWSCSTALMDPADQLQLTLSAPLDAVKAQVPKRVLSSKLVGSIPPTGAIYSQ
jgi:hypothetical protein